MRTRDHPEADGRAPRVGETQWVMCMPLDGGRRLHLAMGRESRERFRAMLEREDVDDALDALEREGDGTEQ